jgi:hypothetical protein
VESFKFNNKHYHPTVAFRIYGNPVTMKLKDFCAALDIAPVGTATTRNTLISDGEIL